MAVQLTTSWQTIASGSWIPGTGFSATFYLDAKYSTQNTVDNTTTIQTRLRSVVNQGTARGNNYSFSCSYANTVASSGLWIFATETITSGESTILHNEDGTKTITLTANAVITGLDMNVSMVGDAILPKIDRGATTNSVSTLNNYVDEAFSVNYTKHKQDYSYKLRISIPTVIMLERIDYNTSDTSFTLSNETLTYLYTNSNSTMSTSNQVQLGFAVEAWDGETRITQGNEIIINVTLNNPKPTFTTTLTELNPKVIELLNSSSANKVVQNASQISLSVSPTAKYNATITKVEAIHGDVLYSDTSSPYNLTIPITTLTHIQNIYVARITIKVTDSRGNVTTSDIDKTVLIYKPVDITVLSMKRVSPTSSNIVLNLEALYYSALIYYESSTPSIINNLITVKWKLDDGTYTTIPSSAITISNNKLTITNYALSNALVYTSRGTFTILLEDKLTSDTNAKDITKGIPTFDAGENDLKVNGNLYVADSDGNNKKEIFSNTYSSNEIVVGKWINDETIYRKVIDTGIISSADKSVAHNISNLDNVISLKGIAKSSAGNYYTLPRVDATNLNVQIGIVCTSQYITLNVGSNANFSESFVIVEYTKSS